MRVAVLTASVSRKAGGLFNSVRRLTEETGRISGVKVIVISTLDEFTADDALHWKGIPLSLSSVAGPKAFGYAPRMMKTLKQEYADVLHSHGLWMYPSLACHRWARRSQVPYLSSPHGMLDSWALRNSWWKKRLAGWLYEDAHLRGAACIHVLCESEADSVRAYGLRNPVCVIPNGVDLPDGRPPGAPSWAAELPEGARVLLYLGRLHPKKGLLDLVRAWASIAPVNRKDWILVIAGWDQGGHQAEVMRLARELGVERSVQFVGAQFGEEKAASYARAEAFVLPSLSEGLPMAVLEAWAYGLPVVMTPQCNLPEGFRAGAAFRVLPDPKSIAIGLAELFAMSNAERSAMGERGRRLVEERFSWPKIAAEMKQVYEWVLGGGERPKSIRLD